MKKRLAAICLTAAMALGLFAPASFASDFETEKSDKTTSSDADELNIIVWEGFWSEEMFQDFADETGIKINISYIANTDEIMTKLIAGGASYDLVDLESGYVQPFIENGLLQKVDHSVTTNEKYIDPVFYKGAPGDEDMEYIVPDLGSLFTTVVYNTETCPIEIKSLKDLADPALKDQVALVDSTISLYGGALRALGYPADSVDPDQMQEAQDLLLQIKPNVKAFVGESAVPQLESGEVSVAYCWDYTTLCADSKDNWDKFDFVNLEGGCEDAPQFWTIPASSEHPDAAMQLINFILRPEELAKCYLEYGQVPLETKEALDPYLPESYWDNPSIEGMKTLAADSWRAPVSTEQIDLMDQFYTELKS